MPSEECHDLIRVLKRCSAARAWRRARGGVGRLGAVAVSKANNGSNRE